MSEGDNGNADNQPAVSRKRNPADHLAPYRFKPGICPNPGGRPKGFDEIAAFRAYGRRKPKGSDRTHFEEVVASIFERAKEGSSRHAKIVMDILAPLTRVVKHETERRVIVNMIASGPPASWQRPVLDVSEDGSTRLLDDKDATDAVGGSSDDDL